MSRRTGASVTLALALAALAGCPDPKGKFDDFVNRVPVRDMAGGGGGVMAYDVTGKHLMGIGVNISPDKPLLLLADVKFTSDGKGGGSLDLSLQPLAVADKKPVGMAATKTGVPVDTMGRFTADFGEQKVPGAANPITGSDIVATLVFKGATLSTDRFCGDVEGMATQPLPLDLAGSTFAAARLLAGDMLPPVESACPKMAGDMLMPPDMSAPADMSVAVDMTAPADMSVPVDMTTTD